MTVNGTNISMIRGDTENIEISMTLNDEVVAFVTGDTVYFTVKTSPDTIVKTFQKTVTSFVGGKAQITISNADTKDLAYGNYYYDVQVTQVGGIVTTIIQPSIFTIASEVTYD